MIRAVILLVLAACSTSKTAEHDLHASSDQVLDGTEHLRVDSTEHADLDEHTIDTSGPSERVDRDFKPLPDGGVYLAHEAVTRRGPRVVEGWQLGQFGADEHVEYDAGVSLRTSARVDEHDKTAEKMKPAGGCMLGLGFWGAVVIAAVLAVGIGVLKLKARAAAKAAKVLLP